MNRNLNRRDFLYFLGVGTTLAIAGFIISDRAKHGPLPDVAKGTFPSELPELSAEVQKLHDGGNLILSGNGSKCFVNNTGEKIIDLLNGRNSVSDISTVLSEQFSVEHTDALETSVAGFICQLAELGMLSSPFYVTMYEVE